MAGDDVGPQVIRGYTTPRSRIAYATVKNVTRITLLTSIERFYDEVPRAAARAEDFGGLTLFVREGQGWPYYARPAATGVAPSAEDVTRVRARQRELGVPEAFEWVDEVTPGLSDAATAAGLGVSRHPLLVLDEFVPVAVPAGCSLRFVGDPDTLAEDYAIVQAVGQVAFGSPGTARGEAGAFERDAQWPTPPDSAIAAERAALQEGRIARVILTDASGPVCVGSYQRAGDVVEIVGVGTLPSARRRGLGTAATAALTRHALDRGAAIAFMSAGDDEVARLYDRVGYRRVATACIAEPT
jgi:GNAT superfamily N-acetyltransferase